MTPVGAVVGVVDGGVVDGVVDGVVAGVVVEGMVGVDGVVGVVVAFVSTGVGVTLPPDGEGGVATVTVTAVPLVERPFRLKPTDPVREGVTVQDNERELPAPIVWDPVVAAPEAVEPEAETSYVAIAEPSPEFWIVTEYVNEDEPD